jgi:GTP-binding protein Era
MQVRMRELAMDELDRMDVILHLHPAPDAPAPAFARVARSEEPLAAPVLTVYTKGDLISPARSSELATEAIVVSAERNEGIDRLLERLLPLLPEREFEYDPDDIGTQQLRFFVVEYLREAAFQLLGEEVPYSFTAEVEEFRETEQPVYIRATLFVERDSQKGIVVGRGGETIRALGAHARRRLEALIGSQVYLDTWVKVLPNWRRQPAALERFGFPQPRRHPA